MKKNFIFDEVNKLKGVGPQLSKYLKRKKIEKVKDIILNLPYSETDRSKLFKLNELELLKNRIKYRASYRGTKEMDILLTSFINSVINNLEYLELLKLDEFLNCNDEDIHNFYFNNNSFLKFNDEKILNLFKSFKI